MDDDEMAQVAEGVVLLPMTAGSVVLAYNLPELPKPLRLPRDVYAKIFLGQISSWSDPAIAAANTDVKLPNLPITVVVGPTAAGPPSYSTSHLAAISPEFAKSPGVGQIRNWPKVISSSRLQGTKASPRASNRPRERSATLNTDMPKAGQLPMAELENKAGKFVGLRPSRPGLSGRRGNARRLGGMVARPPGERFLSHRYLHLAALLRSATTIAKN